MRAAVIIETDDGMVVVYALADGARLTFEREVYPIWHGTYIADGVDVTIEGRLIDPMQYGGPFPGRRPEVEARREIEP